MEYRMELCENGAFVSQFILSFDEQCSIESQGSTMQMFI